MKWLIAASVLILGLFAFLPVAANESLMQKLIPGELQIPGWKAEDEAIIAFDEATLSMVIDGAAPRFIRLGTQKAAFMNYIKEQVYLMLEIYETDSEKNAGKLFDEFRSESAVPAENLGARARLTAEMGGTYMVEYIQDRFYVRVSIMQKSEDAKASIMKCARIISDRITKFHE